MEAIKIKDISSMVNHWLSTPQGSYLGSDYGNNAKDLLQSPQSTVLANSLVSKLKKDIPILNGLGSDKINAFSVKKQPDTISIFLEIVGIEFEIGVN